MLVAGVVLDAVATHTEVSGISKACQNSATCMAAVAKEEEANKNAAAAADSADAFQAKVNELNVDISGKEAEIADCRDRSKA